MALLAHTVVGIRQAAFAGHGGIEEGHLACFPIEFGQGQKRLGGRIARKMIGGFAPGQHPPVNEGTVGVPLAQ